ncbi:MAG: hypothetical protein ACNS62_24435 [Candidatus Cyclobacteriaceae bacterium M3_2C_046]
MKTLISRTKYVLYQYKPILPYYFDQTDILELQEDKFKQYDMNAMIKAACDKNSCTEEEIEIIDVFDHKDTLNNYLISHNLRYLT